MPLLHYTHKSNFMKKSFFFLSFIILSSNVNGQNIDFNIVILDTAEHFNPSPYANAHLDSNLIIDNDSMFNKVFLWTTFQVHPPNFTETIWLKRTIKDGCLTKIENAVNVDSTKQTVTWNTTVESANCNSKDTRHIVVQIPTPPNNYTVLFDTVFLKHDAEVSKINNTIIDSLAVFPYQCELSTQFKFSASGTVIDNDSLFAYWKKDETNCEKPDFSKKLFLINSYGGDCYMRLIPHVFFDPITNVLVLNAYNIWGGCRAGGSKSIAILVDKPNENFNVVFQEIQLENRSEYEQYITHGRNVDNKK